jgi:hypothetical protein
MPSCPFVHQILQSKGQKVPKSRAFKNEGIPELDFAHFWEFSFEINGLRTALGLR